MGPQCPTIAACWPVRACCCAPSPGETANGRWPRQLPILRVSLQLIILLAPWHSAAAFVGKRACDVPAGGCCAACQRLWPTSWFTTHQHAPCCGACRVAPSPSLGATWATTPSELTPRPPCRCGSQAAVASTLQAEPAAVEDLDEEAGVEVTFEAVERLQVRRIPPPSTPLLSASDVAAATSAFELVGARHQRCGHYQAEGGWVCDRWSCPDGYFQSESLPACTGCCRIPDALCGGAGLDERERAVRGQGGEDPRSMQQSSSLRTRCCRAQPPLMEVRRALQLKVSPSRSACVARRRAYRVHRGTGHRSRLAPSSPERA